MQILRLALHPLDKIDMNELAKSESAKRRSTLFRKCIPKNKFTLTTEFRSDVFEYALNDLKLFRYNVLFVCHTKRIPITTLVNELNKQGVKISRTTFQPYRELRNRFPKSLLLSTFAFALDVPTWLLLSDNIESESERLGLFQ
jgi:hypothetical protein